MFASATFEPDSLVSRLLDEKFAAGERVLVSMRFGDDEYLGYLGQYWCRVAGREKLDDGTVEYRLRVLSGAVGGRARPLTPGGV